MTQKLTLLSECNWESEREGETERERDQWQITNGWQLVAALNGNFRAIRKQEY